MERSRREQMYKSRLGQNKREGYRARKDRAEHGGIKRAPSRAHDKTTAELRGTEQHTSHTNRAGELYSGATAAATVISQK